MKLFIKLMALAFMLSINLFYCAGSKKVSTVPEQVPDEAQKNRIIEDFDPETLNEYDVNVGIATTSNTEAANIDQILSGNAQTLAPEVKEIPGYRVQLISTRDEEEARAIKRDALFTFDENVYLTFDDPYYKVRVGDCSSRYQAEELQKEAVKKGFLDAWVVRTKIRNQPTPENHQNAESGNKTYDQK